MPIRFSEYFNLNKTQSQLEFVDIPLDTDILLFVEPYAFVINNDDWYSECHNLIVKFFQALVNAVRDKDYKSAKHLLSNLGEPNETRLGFSKGGPQGRGYAGEKVEQLLENLKKSKAVQSGLVNDIAECELLVPKVGNDTISDMVTNILRRKLIEFTEEQCLKHNIPTVEVNAGVLWNDENGRWESEYRNLPIYEGTRIILVPKKAVRFSLAFDHKSYKDFALNFLRQEHLQNGTSLVKVLKNGNKVVNKKDVIQEEIKNKYPQENIKEFLQDFTAEHPQIFEKYKRLSQNSSRSLSDFELESAQPQAKETEISQLIEGLDKIPKGKKDANSFHNLILKAVEVVFTPFLSGFKKEIKIHDGRKRIDITCDNKDTVGFFHFLKTQYQIKCPIIFIECKNYEQDISNPEYDQLTGRFGRERGRFGLIICREISNKELMSKRIKDVINDERGYLLVLDDEDMKKLLRFREKKEPEKIIQYLEDMFRPYIVE